MHKVSPSPHTTVVHASKGNRRGSIEDDVRSIISGLGKTSMWDGLTALKFTSIYVASGVLLAVLAFTEGSQYQIVLSTIVGGCQVMFIHTAFICNRGTQLFENKLTNNGFVAIVVLVGIANFFVWSQQDVKALEHDCGHADYYETFAEEKKINVLSMIGNICIPLYSLPLYYAWKRKTQELEEQHYHLIVSARRKNVKDPTETSNDEDELTAADEEKTASSVNIDDYYNDGDEDLEKFTFEEYHKIYESKAIHRVYVGGIIFTSASCLGSDFGYLPRSVIPGSFSLVFLAICFTNFVLDGSSVRKRWILRRPRRNTAYLYICCTTLLIALNALTLLRDTMLESGVSDEEQGTYNRNGTSEIIDADSEDGANDWREIIASISITMFSILLVFLWETMAFKAATTETAGPIMFPLYFVIDITQTYLFLIVPFMSFKFWTILLCQEIMGAFRNCGGYEISLWYLQHIFGMKRPFPISDLHTLEELITIAAVDTVAEALAAFSYFAFLIGAKIVGTDNIACLFEPRNDECSENVANLGEMAVTLGIVVLSRVVWFLIERIMFRSCVEKAARSKSSILVHEKSLRRRRASIKKSLSKLVSNTKAGNLTSLLNENCTNETALSDAKAYILDVLQERSEFWVSCNTSKLCNVTVHQYEGKEKLASCPWKKDSLTFMASVILKNCSIDDVLKSDLDFVGEAKENERISREILDAGDLTTLERERVLYQYNRTPFGMANTDAVIADKIEFLGPEEALLIGAPATWEGKEKNNDAYRNRGFVYGMHYTDCSPIGVKRGSFTRVTYVMSIDPSTTGFFPFYFIKKNISSVVASYIDKKGSKFDYAPEDFIRSFVDKMLIKVDADAVIGKVFTGSVNYLVWATVLVLGVVCVNGRQYRAIYENDVFWDKIDGTGIIDFENNTTEIVNCSAVLFGLK